MDVMTMYDPANRDPVPKPRDPKESCHAMEATTERLRIEADTTDRLLTTALDTAARRLRELKRLRANIDILADSIRYALVDSGIDAETIIEAAEKKFTNADDRTPHQ